MKFGPVALADAEGAILAHSVMLPGGALKKGRRLSRVDIDRLAMQGLTAVIVARPAHDAVLEDEAAHRVALGVCGSQTRLAAPFTGRCNLYATATGLVQIDASAMAAINAVDEGITIATLQAFERVEAGQLIATVKIIPFAVDAAHLNAAEALARAAPLHVAAFHPCRVGLILTTLPGTKTSVLAKRRAAVETRVTAMGAALFACATVDHDESQVAAALRDLSVRGADPILVFAASAIVDRADIIPAALVAAGGHIARLGMPVDPGNLLLLGNLGATPVVGIPSCAASPNLNGFDWVLERLIAKLPVTALDIAAMGVGGLLKEIPGRPQPRAGGDPHAADNRQAPRIAGLVLAAGRSTRMGSNKLLEPLGDAAIVRHVVEAVRASSVTSVTVVTGHAADKVAAVLAGLDVTMVHNASFADGLSSSLRHGLAALPPACDGALIALGDMPEIKPEHIDRLIAAFSPSDNRSIVVPVRAGKRGNPVLWSRAHFAAMAAVVGDTGAKHLLGAFADQVAEVDLDTDAVLNDIDTPEALAALRRRQDLR